jgi:segregation and condensation protein A
MSESAFDLDEERGESEPRLIVDVGGYEGPLDVLLVLARQQKVDLKAISILALVDQYLSFVEEARALRLDLAADYLLMAAWLAYLKSRLLIPSEERGDEPSGEDLAEALTERLLRLEAIRGAGAALLARPRIGRDVFARGGTGEGFAAIVVSRYDATLIDLLKAYTATRAKHALARVTLSKRKVWSLADARAALQRLVGGAADWTRLDGFLLQYMVEPDMRASVLASSLATTLELVREGALEVRQAGPFAPIYLKARAEGREGDRG